MAGFTFADSYKAAGLTPGPDIIRLRQQPFDKLRAALDPRAAVNLTRLYFGLWLPDGTDWFRDAFAETDASFSMIDNEREAAVLSACLLAAGMEDRKAAAALAPLTASFAGARQPLVRPELVEEARKTLHESAVTSRQRSDADARQIKAPPKSKVPAEAEALGPAGDWTKAAAVLKQLADESTQGITALATQVAGVVKPLIAQVDDLREEVDMLWWYVGGWSRVLERPFTELTPALAAVMAGLDLAYLTKGQVGPAAAPAILSRLISAGRRAKPEKVSIKDAVDAFPKDAFASMYLDEGAEQLADVCPVLAAFRKAVQIGGGSAGHGSFTKVATIDPQTAIPALDMAMQTYREALLLALMD